MINFFKYFRTHLETTKHKFQVMKFMFKTCCALIKRGWKHDLSKYSNLEAPYFHIASELKNLEYGSDEYKKSLKETLEPALKNHYSMNSHHPEHYRDGIDGMSLLDEIEMLCDWKAATLRRKTGDIRESVLINQKRFKYDTSKLDKYFRFYKEINIW